MKQRYADPGSVSSGTMLAEDLIPAFLDVFSNLQLSKQDRNKVRKLQAEWNACTGELETCNVHTDDPCDEQRDGVLTELFDLLENYAPPYFYFGAHEGDGADYGFWLSEDSLREDEHDGRVWRDNGATMPATADYRLVVSDHGNMSLYTRRGREVWGIV